MTRDDDTTTSPPFRFSPAVELGHWTFGSIAMRRSTLFSFFSYIFPNYFTGPPTTPLPPRAAIILPPPPSSKCGRHSPISVAMQRAPTIHSIYLSRAPTNTHMHRRTHIRRPSNVRASACPYVHLSARGLAHGCTAPLSSCSRWVVVRWGASLIGAPPLFCFVIFLIIANVF